MSQPSAPADSPAGFQKAGTLWNRTFIGLLIAQFLAAFNDQAIHASAMFFAISKKTLTEEKAISLMPILFFAPWAIFCTVAGYAADKYSKRFSLVFWKFAEIAITLVALLGFYLGSEYNMPNTGVWIVLSTVFLMGTHSTFFVPAKYGAMPEILRDDLLSKGNGVLESLSFLATILGTVSGGFLSYIYHDNEYIIGIILVVLAVVGSVASLMIQKMPAANPTRPMPRWVYQPLWVSLKSLYQSKPLRFALVGIAFFTFMVAFMRAAVYMLGESRIPRWTELRTSAIVGMTALGIGLGSPLAGWLSGKKVELGLIPIGSIGMIVAICLAALFLNSVILLIVCIVVIGFFTGFYLVPMFTQLQHRAPKERKGEVISTSNFVNVIGAIVSSFLFYVLVWGAHAVKFAPIVQTDGPESRALTALQEDKNHHVVFFQVEREEGVGRNIGKPVYDVPPIFDEEPDYTYPLVGVSQKALVAWNKYEDALKAGLPPEPVQVRVSKYVILGERPMPHYYLRGADEPLPTLYDNRELPRYLFLGAGAMTLGVLLLLLWILPDLWNRTRWLVWSLGRPRLRVWGVNHLPGHGSVLLATDADSLAERINVRWASDRRVFLLPLSPTSADLVTAEKKLAKGEVVAVSMGLPGGPGDANYTRLSQVPHSTVLPVHVSVADVMFGHGVQGWMDAGQIRAEILATKLNP